MPKAKSSKPRKERILSIRVTKQDGKRYEQLAERNKISISTWASQAMDQRANRELTLLLRPVSTSGERGHGN